MAAYTFNTSTWEVEAAGGSLSEASLVYIANRSSLGYIVRPCLKKKKSLKLAGCGGSVNLYSKFQAKSTKETNKNQPEV